MASASNFAAVTLLLLLLAVACHASPYYPLQMGYYHDKCPQAESIVKAVMEKAICLNPGNGAAVIRMLFHDCFVEVHINDMPSCAQ
jgi:peroxidase